MKTILLLFSCSFFLIGIAQTPKGKIGRGHNETYVINMITGETYSELLMPNSYNFKNDGSKDNLPYRFSLGMPFDIPFRLKIYVDESKEVKNKPIVTIDTINYINITGAKLKSITRDTILNLRDNTIVYRQHNLNDEDSSILSYNIIKTTTTVSEGTKPKTKYLKITQGSYMYDIIESYNYVEDSSGKYYVFFIEPLVVNKTYTFDLMEVNYEDKIKDIINTEATLSNKIKNIEKIQLSSNDSTMYEIKINKSNFYKKTKNLNSKSNFLRRKKASINPTTFSDYVTRTEYRVIADVGVATVFRPYHSASIQPYFGVNFTFGSLNRQVKYDFINSGLRHLKWRYRAFKNVSLMVGTSFDFNKELTNVKTGQKLYNTFSTKDSNAHVNLYTGFGFRIWDAIRVSSGVVWTKGEINKSGSDIMVVKPSSFVALSFDLDLGKYLGKLGRKTL